MVNKKTVDVSVVSANYNNGRFLREYLDSIINSTVQPREIIIVDDGSIDNSLEVLSEYDNVDYLTVIKCPENVGKANAMNIAIDKASGKYIMRCDTDDYISKKRIEIQHDFLENNPDISIVGSNTIYFRDGINKQILRSHFPSDHNTIRKRFHNGELAIAQTSFMGRDSTVKKYKLIEDNVKAEDFDIFARMIRDNIMFNNLKETLTYYRVHSGNSANTDLYDTTRKTYTLRDTIFNKKTSKLKVLINYNHIKYYRKYLFHYNNIVCYIYLLTSAFFRLDKALKRLFS